MTTSTSHAHLFDVHRYVKRKRQRAKYRSTKARVSRVLSSLSFFFPFLLFPRKERPLSFVPLFFSFSRSRILGRISFPFREETKERRAILLFLLFSCLLFRRTESINENESDSWRRRKERYKNEESITASKTPFEDLSKISQRSPGKVGEEKFNDLRRYFTKERQIVTANRCSFTIPQSFLRFFLAVLDSLRL